MQPSPGTNDFSFHVPADKAGLSALFEAETRSNARANLLEQAILQGLKSLTERMATALQQKTDLQAFKVGGI